MDPHPKQSKKERREKRKQILEVIQKAIDEKDKEGRPRYYYIRDGDTHKPTVTVCEIGYASKLYRGISICSYVDNPRKSTGRRIAFDRAVASIMAGTDLFPVTRGEALTELHAAGISIEDWDNPDFFKGQTSPFKNDSLLINAFNLSP